MQTTTTFVTNLSPFYYQEMKSRFSQYNISNEDEFCEALMDIVNLYTEEVFVGNPNTVRSFLYFQDLEHVMTLVYNRYGNNRLTTISLVYESLVLLLQTYTYEMYLNEVNNVVNEVNVVNQI